MSYKEIQNLKRKLTLAIKLRKETVLPLLKVGHQFRINSRKVTYEIIRINYVSIWNSKKRKYVDTKEISSISTKIVSNRRKSKISHFMDSHHYITDEFFCSYQELTEQDKLELL